MLFDYHMHTFLSDGKDSHEDMISGAVFKGLKEIGFTDHICHKPIGWAMPMENIPHMVSRIKAVQSDEDLPISIKFGAEVDYFPDKEKEIAETIQSLELDYVIGSVHFIDDWNFDTDITPYDQIDINRFYKQYFKLVQQSALSGLFDIIGHCDLAKKFGYYPNFPLDDLYDQTAAIFKKADVVVELNTSGKIKPCSEFYPSISFLQRLAFHKVPITLGSDAHVEQNVGQFFNEAVLELKALGFKELVMFNKRQRQHIRLT